MVGGGPWLRVLEAYMVQALLRTPAFHRAVEKVARGVYRMRYGLPPEEMGGTKIDQPGQSTFVRHFYDELRTQLGIAEQKKDGLAVKNPVGTRKESTTGGHQTTSSAASGEEGSDAAWQNAQRNSSQAPKQGFLGEYADALREQIRSGKDGR